MSENIGQSLQLLSKKHGRLTTGGNYPKSSVSAFDRKDSTITKISNIAVIRERIVLPNDSKHVNAFKKVYDRLFREFKEQLVQEYVQMKGAYMQEYQENFDMNANEKQTHIQEAEGMIVKKEGDVMTTVEKIKFTERKVKAILMKKYQAFLKRTAFRLMEYLVQIRRRERRIKVYSKNYMYRRNMRLLFGSWRGVTHQWFKEKINKEAIDYETRLKQEKLVYWDQEVDELKLYMALLQDNIRKEVAEREELAKTYEESLNRGVV